jgi:hypothetical protein
MANRVSAVAQHEDASTRSPLAERLHALRRAKRTSKGQRHQHSSLHRQSPRDRTWNRCCSGIRWGQCVLAKLASTERRATPRRRDPALLPGLCKTQRERAGAHRRTALWLRTAAGVRAAAPAVAAPSCRDALRYPCRGRCRGWFRQQSNIPYLSAPLAGNHTQRPWPCPCRSSHGCC